jgi:hypothetical protein
MIQIWRDEWGGSPARQSDLFENILRVEVVALEVVDLREV